MTTPAKPSAMPWEATTSCVDDANGKLVTCVSGDAALIVDEANAALAVAAVNALHAIAPGRELEAANALPGIVEAARDMVEGDWLKGALKTGMETKADVIACLDALMDRGDVLLDALAALDGK